MTRQKIVVITTEVIGPKLAGPGIRARHIADALAARGHEVELLTTERCEPIVGGIPSRHVTRDDLDRVGARADIVIVQGDVLRRSPQLRSSPATIVVDLYDPFHLEALESTRALSAVHRRSAVGVSIDIANEMLRRGDFFICASDRQRDFWLGQLAAVGRVNELTYDADPSLGDLIAIVPFGIEPTPPQARRSALRGVVPGIDADARILYWGGGIYNWFDPLTLIRAVDEIRRDDPRVKLVFPGSAHPNPSVDRTAMSTQARALAVELGLLDEHVFFLDWIEYDARADLLLDADAGVSTHAGHVEAAYSFRTRMLDYLWAGLPTVASRGDTLSEMIEAAGAGVVVDPGDAVALGAALRAVVLDDAARADMAVAATELARAFTWPVVLEPLIEFCDEPRRSPDLVSPDVTPTIERGGDLMRSARRAGLERAAAHARHGEWRELKAMLGRRFGGDPLASSPRE